MQSNDKHESARRRFFKASALGAVGALASPVLSSYASPLVVDSPVESQLSSSPHRIKKLALLTSSPLSEMATFYQDVLEMKVQLSETRLVVEGGATQITFSPAPEGMKPYYHFAFNIPENKILSARTWLGARTKLAITPAQARTAGYPNEIRAFGFWNSHSVFFWDPAGNILELICRHDMKNGTKGEFRSEEILYASEIGFVAEGSVNELAAQIRSTFQLEQYRDGGDSFRAIGDETGLLILFSRGGTPVGAQAGQSWQVFPTDVTVSSSVKLESKKLPHSIRTG